MGVRNKGGIGCRVNGKDIWPHFGGRAFWQYARKKEAFSTPRQGTRPNLGSELHGCMTQFKSYTS